MLVLTRKDGERIVIDGGITVEVVEAQGGRVRLGISAPPEVRVMREELIRAPARDPRVERVRGRMLAPV